MIFGVALLAICLLTGTFLGDLLGMALGINANVGGVGLAMLMLVLIVDFLKKKNMLSEPAQQGLGFWSGMYIPIVIAMSSSQNVAAALDGGTLAIIAGAVAVFISWACVPLLSKGGKATNETTDITFGGDGHARNIE